MSEQALKSSTGSFWVQPGGANKPIYWLGCATLEDISDSAGGTELIQCFDPSTTPENTKWRTVGSKSSPPDPASFTVETLLFAGANQLEKVRGRFAAYALSREQGRADSFSNYVRGSAMINAKVVSVTRSNIVHRNEDNEALKSFECEASPPVYDLFDVTVTRKATTEAEDALCCFFYEDDLDALEVGLTGIIGCVGGVAAANVLRTTDGGAIWAAAAGQPFAIGESIMSVAQIQIDKTTVRWIAVRDGDAANPLEIGYSDDNGATWTNVNVGATNNEGAVGPKALCALDQFHMWLVTDTGYVYFSDDAGETWSIQDPGVATAQPLNGVHFVDQLNGFAVADSDEIIVTTDGGESWTPATATGGGNNLLSVWTMSDRVWVCDDGGELYYSEDGGTTWTQRTGWTGSGTGEISDIAFFTDYFGIMIHDSVAPVGTVLMTINGGTTWEVVDTPTNSGLHSVYISDQNTAYVTGAANAGTAVILKVNA